MPGNARQTSFTQAVNAALADAMALDRDVFVCGIAVDAKVAIFGTTQGLQERFGAGRVLDTPISEQALTAMAVGAANAGLRPVLVHQRVDFMLYSMDQIVNWMAAWRFMSGGRAKMPVTIRVIVGKGWGQGPQHSKSLHAWFAHVPGLKVVMPSTPIDAKGLLLSSIFSDDPVIFIEGRSLYSMKEGVPSQPYFIKLGEAAVRKPGGDLTLVSFGSSVPTALQAAEILAREQVDAEVLDLRCLMPFDLDAVLASVGRTRRLVVVEPGWTLFGAGAEIVSSVAERMGPRLLGARRVGWPHSFVPTSAPIEAEFYPTAEHVAAACREAVR